ncbi:hypothetical protein AB4455_19445 [Vibrio sp. 10N.261.46.E12]|nr:MULTISPECIES: hypothetical protein [unclassified Vibrio]
MALLSGLLKDLRCFGGHSLGFYGRGNSVMVMAKTDANKGQTVPLKTISVFEYWKLFDEIFSHNDKDDFQKDKQFINIDINSVDIQKLGFSHITVTQQPLTSGQFVSAITTHISDSGALDEELEIISEGIQKAPLSVEKRFAEIEKNAELAEQAHLDNLLKSRPFWLSQKDVNVYKEFEIRPEPLILHDAKLESGGYNPFWGWWQF